MTDWEMLGEAAEITDLVVVGLLTIQFMLFLLVFVAACVALLKRPPFASPALLWRRYAQVAPPITIISPAYNEGFTIVESVEALLALEYPAFEVVVVNDGSSDDTLERLVSRFGLLPAARLCEWSAPHAPIRGFYASPRVPRLLVVDKDNGGGKADAVNAGINASRTPIICITDADTLIEPDALLRAVWPFVDEPLTIAVGGTICIANGSKVHRGRVVEPRLPRNFLALVQTLEYERAFMLARLGLSCLGALMIVSGAFGLFRRDAVMEVGGYSLGTVGEDLELVVKLHRHFRTSGQPYAIRFLAEPVVWTQAPESLGDLGRQRARWERGSLETFRKHRSMALNPRFGAIGLIGFGQLLIVDVVGPLVSVMGYVLVPTCWAIGLLSREHFLAFVAAVFSFGILMSVLSLILEQVFLAKIDRARDLATLAAIAVVENFGYRQLCNLWRVWGWYQYLRKQEGWGPMTRQEFKRV
ncbi:MAG TPA: glycosyltransferase [Allosphingosinicella sp.]|jgi:cellulose synthase/poly-beta-1,6-N-acetylglucosamine synthase-like glycosyltransferase